MRAALFAPVTSDDSALIGKLTESAIFSQWQHSLHFRNLKYARWKNEGEVDVVYLSQANQKPIWVGEIKWSDRIEKNASTELTSLSTLLKKHKSVKDGFFTSKSIKDTLQVDGRRVNVIPSAAYCYIVGRNITAALDAPFAINQIE
jgi:hypothetical protein